MKIGTPRVKKVATRVGAVAGVVAIAVALGASPANATTVSGGAKTCSALHDVETTSTSAGQTDHYQVAGGRTFHQNFGNVSASSPYRGWNDFFTHVDSWHVTADVLESATATCVQAPQ